MLPIEKCSGVHFLKGIEACTTRCEKTAFSNVIDYYLLKYNNLRRIFSIYYCLDKRLLIQKHELMRQPTVNEKIKHFYTILFHIIILGF